MGLTLCGACTLAMVASGSHPAPSVPVASCSGSKGRVSGARLLAPRLSREGAAFPAHCSLCVCSHLSSHLCHLLLGPAEPSWALSPNHDPHSTLMMVSSLHSLLGFSLSHLSKGLNLGDFYPRGRRLFGRRKNGGPGTSSGLWALQIGWLLLDGGDLALCRKEDRGPHPTPQLGTLGRKQETHSLQLTAVPSVTSFLGGEGRPSHQSTGEEAESLPVWRAQVELLKIAPVKEEQGSQRLFTLRSQRLSFPEDSTSPTAASGPCPSLWHCWVLSPGYAAVRQDRRRSVSSEQKSASQLPTCLLSKPFVISVLVELVFGVLCFKVFVFVCLSFVLRGWGGIQSS